jgi:aminoglycoside phosphotransferase (APT) family kinase protein
VEPSFEIDAATAAVIIARQFPQLAPVTVEYLGAGMDSIALEVNARWIFRFPMRATVEQQLFVEQRLLPAIAPRLSLPVPAFTFAGKPDDGFGMYFTGYEKLRGTPAVDVVPARVSFDAIAAQLGRFLSAVHGFPVAEAERLGARTSRLETYFEELRTTALAGLDRVRSVAADAVVARLRRYLEQLEPLPIAPWPLTLTHNDLAAEHILLDESATRVTGVIDWGDISIADPTIDFVGLFGWGGEPFVRTVLASYDGPATELVLGRVRPWTAFRAVQDIQFGLDRSLPEVVKLAVRALEIELTSI